MAFTWNAQRSRAAELLALGYSQVDVSEEVGVTTRTIRNWLSDPEFDEEVMRLTHIRGVALRAERLKTINRVVRELLDREEVTQRDLLDWLKFAQSETDGAKLNLTQRLLDVDRGA